MKKFICFFSVFALLSVNLLSAQQDTSLSNQQLKKNLIVTGIVLQQLGSFYIEYNWWWKNNYHPFNLKNDGWFYNYSYGIDKVGHFYVSYLYYHVLHEILTYGGFSPRSVEITSAVLPSLWALSIELGDGFSRFAFNPDDLLANLLGVAYGLAQNNLKVLKPFVFKMSYFPSSKYFQNNFKNWVLSEDYDGHIYWLTINLHQLKPELLNAQFFRFINLGVGYGINGYGSEVLKREFFLGFDLNLSAFKTNRKGITAIKNIVDKWHLPAPGIKFNHHFEPGLRALILN